MEVVVYDERMEVVPFFIPFLFSFLSPPGTEKMHTYKLPKIATPLIRVMGCCGVFFSRGLPERAVQ
jgi:hypothetical protein